MTAHPIEQVLAALNAAIALQDLLALKREAKRPQDLADVEALEAVAKARARP